MSCLQVDLYEIRKIYIYTLGCKGMSCLQVDLYKKRKIYICTLGSKGMSCLQVLYEIRKI